MTLQLMKNKIYANFFAARPFTRQREELVNWSRNCY
jgi:hypothetical protein